MSGEEIIKQAHAAFRAGDYAAAERGYRELIPLHPFWGWHNLGVVLANTRRYAEAEEALRKALAVQPRAAHSQHSLGMLLLGEGRYAEGWALMEARRDVLQVPKPDIGCPYWAGEDLAGKHIVVWGEQGFGDQIQFARFLAPLKARGARVTFVCSPALFRLFEPLGIELIAATREAATPEADYWSLVCSLPLHLGVRLEDVSGAPYLPQPSAPAPKGIGVVVKGRPTHPNDRNRSLPPEAAARLLALGRNLLPEATGARDFYDTARIVAGLELVVCVDTSIAHLCGAMGKPCWVLVPAIEPDWRWMREGPRTPWYDSLRLYRQTAADDWTGVLDRVEADLAAAGLRPR